MKKGALSLVCVPAAPPRRAPVILFPGREPGWYDIAARRREAWTSFS